MPFLSRLCFAQLLLYGVLCYGQTDTNTDTHNYISILYAPHLEKNLQIPFSSLSQIQTKTKNDYFSNICVKTTISEQQRVTFTRHFNRQQMKLRNTHSRS